MRLTSTGWLGIGTKDPKSRLEVTGYIQSSEGLKFNDTDRSYGLFALGSQTLAFNINGSEKVRIASNGNTGIGTNDPKTRLHVRQSEVANAPARSSAIYLENDGNCEIQMVGNTANDCQIRFGTSDNSFKGLIEYDLTNDSLDFYTANSKHVTFANNGNVGIGFDAPSQKLEIEGTVKIRSANQLQFNNSNNSSGASVQAESVTTPPGLTFNTYGQQRMVLDSSGRLTLGHTSAVAAGGRTARLQIHGTGADTAGQTIIRYANNAVGPAIFLGKSRSETNGQPSGGQVVSGDGLGYVIFGGADGTNLNSQSAYIGAFADSTPSTGRVPGRISFFTTSTGSGAGTPSERFRIYSDGRVGISQNSNTTATLQTGYEHDIAAGTRNGIRCSDKITTGSATNAFNCFNTRTAGMAVGVAAESFRHYWADANSVAGTVTKQIGFGVAGNLTGATNNYGFYSDIYFKANAWNFYANGDAYNFFKGETYFISTDRAGISAGTTTGKFINSNGVLESGYDVADEAFHIKFNNSNGSVGSITTEGNITKFNENSDYRLKENINPLTGATDLLKALKPCVYNFKADPDTTLQGFIAHEAQEVCPQAVSGTKDATEAIGTLLDWDGSVREENVTEPKELTYSEEVIDDPGQEGKEAVYSEPELIQEYQPPVYSEPVLIQEYQPAVYGEPELIQEYQPAVYAEPELVKEATEDEEAVYADPVLITPEVLELWSDPELISPEVPEKWSEPELVSPEVPEKWSEPELISPAAEEREPTYKTVTRQMSWTKTGDRDVMQGIDKSKLVPLLTAALQEALGRIEALEAAIATKGA